MKQTSSPALPGQTPTCRFIEVLAGRSGDCGGFFLPSSVASHFNELLAPLQRFRPGQELGFDDTEMGPVCGAKLHAWIVIVSVRRKSGHMPELVARRLRLRPLPEVRLRFTPSCQPFFGTYGF